ncbi:hypothetical protein VPH35_123466 [Triticum aestivum]
MELQQLMLVATLAGNCSGVSCAEVALALQQRFHLAPGDTSVHRHHPEPFLLRFADPASDARVAAGNARFPRFRLFLHPWSSLAGAEPVDLLFTVDIEMTGIPDHAWHRSMAELLLAPFCEIEHLAPETRDGSDRSAFKLSAWTNNPDAIPRHSELFLPDADAVLPDANPAVAERLSLRVYRRPVTIFVTETTDYRRPAPLP